MRGGFLLASPRSPFQLWNGSKCSDKLFFHLHEHLCILWFVFVCCPCAKHPPWLVLLRNFELLCSVIKRVKSRQILNRFRKNAALLRVQDAGVLLLIKITCFHFHWEFLLSFQQQYLFLYLVLGFECVSLIKEVQIKWIYYTVAANSSPTGKQQEKLWVETIGKRFILLSANKAAVIAIEWWIWLITQYIFTCLSIW